MAIVEVVIETPKGSAAKYAFDPERRLFKLKRLLPAGMVFPYDFGFIPGTLAEDGDPLDAIVLSEPASFPGCVVECRIVGAIAAMQDKHGKQVRNDRVLAIPTAADALAGVASIAALATPLLDELERFFIAYNAARGQTFVPLERLDAAAAARLVEKLSKPGR